MRADLTLNESIQTEGRSMRATRRSHEAFRRAWAAAGYPRHYRWDPKKGRLWTREAIRENIEFKSMSPEAQKVIIESRELAENLRKLRASV